MACFYGSVFLPARPFSQLWYALDWHIHMKSRVKLKAEDLSTKGHPEKLSKAFRIVLILKWVFFLTSKAACDLNEVGLHLPRTASSA